MEKDFYEWILKQETPFVEKKLRCILADLNSGYGHLAVGGMIALEKEWVQECQDAKAEEREAKHDLIVPKGE